MKNYSKGFVAQGIIAIVALILIVGGVYFINKQEVVAPVSEDITLDDPQYLTPLQTLEIAQEVNPKECLDFDGIRENGFVTYNVSRKFGNGCPEKIPTADYPMMAKIKVDLKTGEAFSGTIDGRWKPFTNTKQTLRVISPNGGEVVSLGNEISITFVPVAGEDYSINLVQVLSDTSYNLNSLHGGTKVIGLTSPTQTFSVTIPKNYYDITPGSRFKMDVCSSEGNCDDSDGFFTITP